jgi:hypothetical protein
MKYAEGQTTQPIPIATKSKIKSKIDVGVPTFYSAHLSKFFAISYAVLHIYVRICERH